MKKTFFLFVIILMVLTLTGCFEIIQMISIKNGLIHTSIRYTLQKSVFEMGASFSGEDIDYDDFLKEGDETFSYFSGLAGKIKKYETPFDIGAEITIDGSQKAIYSMLDGENDFIPVKHNDKYIIEIPLMGDDEEVDEFAIAFLSGAKYRLILSRANDLEHITEADLYIENQYNEKYELTDEEEFSIQVTGSIMLIEIPMILFFLDEGKVIVELS